MESTTNASIYTCEQNITKEYKGAKKKRTIPQRMLEDDVWLSGSELRTDNSSSDEDAHIPRKKSEEDDFKKGARKKTMHTKTKVVQSLTEKHQYSEITECTETLTSMTSEITIDTENTVQFMDIDELSKDEQSYFQECQRQKRKAYESIVSQLENQIQHAEELYMTSKERTNIILKNLSMVFEPFSNHEDNNLRKFIEIIRNLAMISANCYLEDSSESQEKEKKNMPQDKIVRFHVKKHKEILGNTTFGDRDRTCRLKDVRGQEETCEDTWSLEENLYTQSNANGKGYSRRKNFSEAKALLELLEKKRDELTEINLAIREVLLVDPTMKEQELEEEIMGCDEYELKFNKLKAKFNTWEKKEEIDGINQRSSADSDIAHETRRQFKLPVLELKKFSGELKEWLPFWSQFKKINEDPHIDNGDKFQYLIQATTVGSRARELVESFPATSENYLEAVRCLKKRYGRDDLLVEVYVRDLLALILKNTMSVKKMSLASLYDKLESQLRALETLQVTTDRCASLLMPLVESCLPEDILRAWQRSSLYAVQEEVAETDQSEIGEIDVPGYRLKRLLRFLQSELENEQKIKLALSGFGVSNISMRKEDTKKEYNMNYRNDAQNISTAAGLLTTVKEFKCVFCGDKHASAECKRVQKMSVVERKCILNKRSCCYRCLMVGHRMAVCRRGLRCAVCGKTHHTLICEKVTEVQHPSTRQELTTREIIMPEQQDKVLANMVSSCKVMLQTFLVKLKGRGSERITRAIIDTGSQRSYILRDVVIDMQYKPVRKERIRHALFAGLNTSIIDHEVYKIHLSDLNDKNNCQFEVLDQHIICGKIEPITPGPWMRELEKYDIHLTDLEDKPIEILLGADVAGSLFTGKQREISADLLAIETKLGWTLIGCVPETTESENTAMTVTSMMVSEAEITDLWALDVIGIMDPVEKKRKRELQLEAEQHFLRTVTVDEEGRYSVHLPWIEDHPPLPSNYELSLKRLKATNKKLKESGHYEAYEAVLNEWIQEGIIEEVSTKNPEEGTHYLPHRAVVKMNSSTKIRPVFDASAKERGHPSLNSCLEKGPNLIELIPSVLMKFRLKKIGVVADIRKAFLQISLFSRDRDFLRFMWCNSENQLKIYRHRRVVFGVSSSPFLLGSVIRFHLNKILESCLKDEQPYSPAIVENLLKCFYVDNCVTSVADEQELRNFMKEAVEIMKQASFDLRGWEYTSSNADERDERSNVLGMLWNRRTDTLEVSMESFNSFDLSQITKRSILSATHRIFDPVGVTCPLLLIPKLLLQQIWSQNIGWDESVSDEEKTRFLKWKEDLIYLKQLRIPRWLISTNELAEYTLHVFGDASQYAYAAVVFLRTETSSRINVQLVQAKSRISPINKEHKRMTIPRLELLAANIGVRLFKSVSEDINIPIVKTMFWSDSTPVLAWIERDEQWDVFVRNRVKEIRETTSKEQWRYIPGIYNPADLPSRGCNGKKLIESQWWNGPAWLRQSPNDWPSHDPIFDENEINYEKKKSVISSTVMICSKSDDDWYYKYFSRYKVIVRLIAWILRFRKNCLSKNGPKECGELTVEEFTEAETKTLWLIQKDAFSGIDDTRLSSLQTLMGTDGLIRLRTKISQGDYDVDFCYPVVLPNHKHPVVYRLIFGEHIESCHAGIQTTMTILRRRYWILGGRRSVRSVLRKCAVCKRFTAKRIQVQSPPLPVDRVRDAKIFEIVGIDFAGPLYVKTKGGEYEKAWVCLFTCAVYRVVHLELLSSLSTERFILCLRKFISRRGRPSTIYTDNGTNFVGTANALDNINWSKIETTTVVMKIKWKFNPPTAAWWGGWWERLVGLLKQLLRRILGKTSLDFDEMQTVLCECEAIINARPLTYLSEDTSDLTPLTPDLFLKEIGEIGVPDLDVIEATPHLDKRGEYRQRLRKMLKKRFCNEYLGRLTLFAKKFSPKGVSVGELVLIEKENAKRIDWPLARIEEVFHGRDGVVRLVKLRTSSGIMLRPVQRIIPLEMNVSPSEREPKMTHTNENMEVLPAKGDTTCGADTVQQFTRSGRLVKTPIQMDL